MTWEVWFGKIEDRALGECDPGNRVIKLDPDQPPLALERTYIHEVLHAAWPAGEVTSKQEERIIRKMEYALQEAIRNGAFEVEE